MTNVSVTRFSQPIEEWSGTPDGWDAGVYVRDVDGYTRTIVVDASGDWVMFNATRAGGFKTGLTNEFVNGTYTRVASSLGRISDVTVQ